MQKRLYHCNAKVKIYDNEKEKEIFLESYSTTVFYSRFNKEYNEFYAEIFFYRSNTTLYHFRKMIDYLYKNNHFREADALQKMYAFCLKSKNIFVCYSYDLLNDEYGFDKINEQTRIVDHYRQ